MRASVALLETGRYFRIVSDYEFIPRFIAQDSLEWRGTGWLQVSGGGLDSPIYIRLAHTRDGGSVINGLIMGGDEQRPEITANTLRQIKPREILSTLLRKFDLLDRPEDFLAYITWSEVYLSDVDRIPSQGSSVRGSGTADLLDEFARIYMKERAIQPHRAMTAAAEAMHISRATANRWAARARERGLIPAQLGDG